MMQPWMDPNYVDEPESNDPPNEEWDAYLNRLADHVYEHGGPVGAFTIWHDPERDPLLRRVREWIRRGGRRPPPMFVYDHGELPIAFTWDHEPEDATSTDDAGIVRGWQRVVRHFWEHVLPQLERTGVVITIGDRRYVVRTALDEFGIPCQVLHEIETQTEDLLHHMLGDNRDPS